MLLYYIFFIAIRPTHCACDCPIPLSFPFELGPNIVEFSTRPQKKMDYNILLKAPQPIMVFTFFFLRKVTTCSGHKNSANEHFVEILSQLNYQVGFFGEIIKFLVWYSISRLLISSGNPFDGVLF